MGNYFAQLAAPNPGQGIDFAPVGNALAQVSQTNQRNALLGLEQQRLRSDVAQRQFENARQTKQDQLALIQRGAEQANAIDQLYPVGDPRRAAAWQQHLAQHKQMFPNDQITPEEMDPNQGPKIYATQAGMALQSPAAMALQKAQAADLNSQAGLRGQQLDLARRQFEFGKQFMDSSGAAPSGGNSPAATPQQGGIMRTPDGKLWVKDPDTGNMHEVD